MKKLFLFTLLLMYSLVTIAQEKPEPVNPFYDGNLLTGMDLKSNENVYTDGFATLLEAFTYGGNRLVALQNIDGGWDWPLDDGDPNSVSPVNTIGPIAMGLAQAYQQTGIVTQRTALLNAGALLLTKTNNFSLADGYLAAQLDKIYGGTTYTSHVKTNFYDKLESGIYDRSGLGTLYSTASYIDLVRTSRSGSQANMAAWDIGMGLVAASMCGANTTAWITGVKAEINELDGLLSYDVIGLAGAVYGLALVNEDFDPTAGWHAAASNINDLAATLASYQIAGGGFAWNQAWVIQDDGDEDIQATAYSILALNEVNRTTYLAKIQGAANYMSSVQLITGGWSNYQPPLNTPQENNEVTAEALWGISVAYPAPVYNSTKDVYYPTIQGAINDANSGNVINVAAGTYLSGGSFINVNKSLSIIGENKTNTFIDVSANGPAWGISLAASNTMLKNFTVIPANPPGADRGGYPIHAAYNITPTELFNITLENIVVDGSDRTGIDFNGVTNVVVSNVTSTNTAAGNGMQFSGCKNVTVNNVITSGNAWGGIAVYVSKPADLNRGSDNINIDGTTCILGENNKIYNQDEVGLFNTNITVTGFDYLVKNSSAVGYKFYQINQTAALAFAAALTNPFNSSVQQISTGQFFVNPTLRIQTAVSAAAGGDIINVLAGTFVEPIQIDINKNLTILGTSAATTIVKPGFNTTVGGNIKSESFIYIDPLATVVMKNITIDCAGQQVNHAIQSRGALDIEDCVIKNVKWGTYNGRGIVYYGGTTNNLVKNLSMINVERIGVHVRGNVMSPNPIISIQDFTYTGKGPGDWLDYGIEFGGGGAGSVDNADISNCKGIASTDGSTSAGILVTDYFGTGTNATITNSTLSNNSTGMVVGYGVGDNSIVVAHNNDLSNNTSLGISSNNPPVNAELNWWGTAVESEIQAKIEGPVDYDPWIGKAEMVNVTQLTPTVYNFPTAGVIMEFSTLSSGGGNVTVARYNEVPSGFPVSYDNVGMWLDIISSMPNYSFDVTVKVDVSGLGFDGTQSVMYYNSTTSSWVAITGGIYLASDLSFGGHPSFSFTTNHFTPFTFINTPATAYNVYLSSSTTASAGVIYPNNTWGATGYEPDDWDFTTPVSFYIVPAVGSKFGASDITIQWDNTMFGYVGIDKTGGVYDNASSQFFITQTGNQVTINAGRFDNTNVTIGTGQYIAKLNLNLLKPGFGPISFTGLDFRSFDGAGDQLGVYVTGNNAQIKSYLGDVASVSGVQSTGDGLVEFEDLSAWTISYWSGVGGTGMANYKVKYDVGPTTTNTVYGLPTTDGKIQFEDLVIFAMSYGLSHNNVYPKLNAEPTEPVELKLGNPIFAGNQTRVPLLVSGGVQNVRAMNLTFAGNFGKLVSVEKGELITSLSNPVMVMKNVEGNQVFVDFAVFGANDFGISTSGEVLTLVFEGNADININSANVRNILNGAMKVNFSGSVETIPDEFALLQNYPNPFNPSTTISYNLPKQAMVEISVFNALGENVATLVNELKEAGRYNVELNAAGYSSGIYFYQIKANDFVSVKKMILMK